MTNRRADALLFDLDGTLTDSAPGIAATVSTTLIEAGLPAQTPSAVYPLIGLPLALLFRTLVPAVDETMAERLVVAYRERYARECVPTARLFPGALDVLERARVAGMRLGLVTSKPVAVASAMLTTCRASGHLDVIVGGDSVARGKPAPDMIELALRTLAAAPARAIVIGDSVHDAQMARAAGATAWGVGCGVATANELRRAGVERVFGTFDELRSALFD